MLNILCSTRRTPSLYLPLQTARLMVAAPARHDPFPFGHEPNTFGWNRIVVPTGWDSRDKIAVVRNSLDSKAWGETWGNDPSSASAVYEGGALPHTETVRAASRHVPFPTVFVSDADCCSPLPRSTILHRNGLSSQGITTRTCTVQHIPVVPWMYLRRVRPVLSGLCVRRPSLYGQLSACSTRWEAVAQESHLMVVNVC